MDQDLPRYLPKSQNLVLLTPCVMGLLILPQATRLSQDEFLGLGLPHPYTPHLSPLTSHEPHTPPQHSPLESQTFKWQHQLQPPTATMA